MPGPPGQAAGRPGRHGRDGRRGRLLASAGLVLACSACRADVGVDVNARADGGGVVTATVTLDREATEALPELSSSLRVDDLRAAGWSVDGPRAVAGGTTTVAASKPFADPAGASRVLDELTGGDGPLSTLELAQERSFLRTRTSLRGSVDLRSGIEVFADDEVRQLLGDGARARPLAEVLPDGTEVGVRLEARLPGRIQAGPVQPDGRARWVLPLGGQTQVDVVAEQRDDRRLTALGGFGVAAVAALGLVASLVLGRRRRQRQARGTRGGVRTRGGARTRRRLR